MEVWGTQDDDLLFQIASEFHPKNWKSISKKFNSFKDEQHHKSSKNCRQRFELLFEDKKRKKTWSLQQLTIFSESIFDYGTNWRLLESVLPGRSQVTVKNKFNSTIRYFLRSVWKCLGNNSSEQIKRLSPQELIKIYSSRGKYLKSGNLIVKKALKKLNFLVSQKSIMQIVKFQREKYQALMDVIHQNLKLQKAESSEQNSIQDEIQALQDNIEIKFQNPISNLITYYPQKIEQEQYINSQVQSGQKNVL